MVTYEDAHTTLRDRLQTRFDKVARVLTFAEWEQQANLEEPFDSEDMLAVVDTAIETLQGLYVHMDLKRARRGVDPVRQLTVLKERLSLSSRTDVIAARTFHQAMLEIFKSLGDAHTAYRLPEPHKFAIAFLPFLINAYQRGDGTRGYVVSHVLREGESQFKGIHFTRGVELTSWNGVSIEDAVKRATDFEEGSNTPHDFLLALQFMTVRWLGASFGPESPWVVVGYTDDDGQKHEVKFNWLTLLFDSDPKIIVTAQGVASLFDTFHSVQEQQRALHVGSDLVHAGRVALFVEAVKKDQGTLVELERLGLEFTTKFFGYFGRADMKAFTDAQPLLQQKGDELPSLLPMFFVAHVHTVGEVAARITPAPKELASLKDMRFGYIGIRAFPPMGFPRSLFTYEFRRLLNLMPGGGLVLDIRDNPGGSANLAEESLQLLTPNPITPLPFRFIASASTRTITNSLVYLEYKASVETALQTGGRFSAGRPITDVRHANEIGQHYFGPVVLVTNGATYSAADVFAAGFVDHSIGPLLGLDETTGGGGANCWFYQEDIVPVPELKAKPLPRGVNLQVAVRQCARVGKENDGVPIEEIGVRSASLRYALTKEDILASRPWGLLLHAARQLAAMPSYDLVTRLVEGGQERRVIVETQQIDRLDFFVNGRPSSVDVKGPETPSPLLPFDDRVELEIRGYIRPNTLVARWVQVFPFLESRRQRADSPRSDDTAANTSGSLQPRPSAKAVA